MIDKERLEKLVNEAKAGNKDAFSELIKYVEPDLYNIAKSRLPSLHDAQDILQITLTAAYLNIHKLKNPRRFKSWIIKILINACNKFYEKSKSNKKVSDDFADIPENTDYIEADINFDDMIKDLPEDEQQLLKLKFKDDLTFNTIARELNLNENTVKSRIYRSLGKLRQKYSIPTLLMFVLCFLVATTVIAVSIISYIQHLFSTSNVGIENPGVLMAIEHKDWFQKVDMDYVDLGDGYKIKADYLLMDEMCLYIAFDLISENEDISDYTTIILPDITITDNFGNVICDEINDFSEQYREKLLSTLVESDGKHSKLLLTIYANSLPKSNELSINMSNIYLENGYTSHNLRINHNIKITLPIADKFINRTYITYVSSDNSIEKAIITETGFYAIIKFDNIDKTYNAKLIDESGRKYDCYSINLLYDSDENSFHKLITCPYNFTENKQFKLTIKNKKYEIIKKE